MVMLSEILRFKAVDEAGRTASVADLAVKLDGEDYPPVIFLYVPSEDGTKRFAWDSGATLDIGRRTISVPSLEGGEDCPEPAEDKDVLLARDVLDALVIDLRTRETTRASDLSLEENEDGLRLMSADPGFGAMVRRITRGVIADENPKVLIDWRYVEFLRGDPKAVRNGAGYQMRIGRLPPGEIARITDYLPYLHAAELIRLLPEAKSAKVFQSMSIERQVQVIDELEFPEAVEIMARMSADLATDLLGRVLPDAMKRYLGALPKLHSERVVQLLRYPEDSVGGAMTNNLIAIQGDVSAADARLYVQERLRGADLTSMIFVIDSEGDRRLRGTATLIDLLAAQDFTLVEELMDPYLETLEAFNSAREAAHRILSSEVVAMPVTDEDGRLIGAMTINSAVAQLVPPSSSLQALKVFS